MFILNTNNGLPLYLQIAEQTRLMIQNGSILPGQHLPSIDEISSHCQIGRFAIQKAFTLLEDEKLLQKAEINLWRVFVKDPEQKSEKLSRIRPDIQKLAILANSLNLDHGSVSEQLKTCMEQNQLINHCLASATVCS